MKKVPSTTGNLPQRKPKYLGAMLTFVKELSAEQLKEFPILRGFVNAVQKLSDDEAGRRQEELLNRLVGIGEQTQEDLDFLTEINLLQTMLLVKLLSKHDAADISTEQRRLAVFSLETALGDYAEDLRADLSTALGNTPEHPELFHFVEQPVSRYAPPARNEMEAGREQFISSNLDEVKEAIRSGRSVLLVAEAGVGKSVVLWHLALSLCESGQDAMEHLPVICKCSALNPVPYGRKLAEWRGLIPKAMPASVDLRSQIATDLVDNRRVVFLFDGLDQVGDPAQQKTITDEVLDPKRERFSGCPVVLTSRFEKVNVPQFHQDGFAVFKLEPFDDEGVNAFYGEEMLENPQVRNLLTDEELRCVGFFARMVKWMHHTGGLAKITTKGELFRQYLGRFLQRAADAGYVKSVELQGIEACLRDISLAAYQQDEPAILEVPSEIVECFKHHQRYLDALDRASLAYLRPIVDLEPHDPLAAVTSRPLVFQHQIVQDYYAAQALLRKWDEGVEAFNAALGQVGTFILRMAEFILEGLVERNAPLRPIHDQLYKNQLQVGERLWRMTYLLYLRDNLVERLGLEGELAAIRDDEAEQAREKQITEFGPEPWEWLEIPGTDIRYKMIKIPSGLFLMGGWRNNDEKPVRWIEITKPFLMGEVPVTQGLYEAVAEEEKKPSRFKGENRPVEQVSWPDAVRFCNALSKKLGYASAYEIEGDDVRLVEGATGFRLPSEAEWECGCRAGTTTERYGEIDKIAWYTDNSGRETKPVKDEKKLANKFGLHDMLGNVWEWCQDWYDDKGYLKMPGETQLTQDNSAYRVVRGGGWGDTAGGVRASFRDRYFPVDRINDVGFRISRDC
ncbi:MAG: SUMF1/EgtB/PvdO family nonheme iron enzyme [Candidatus Lernaella stagnicola]|nr:SUMF1/EgtB/PvdO family nonheme iron enzyme [Candidatus Lernaella stagnicola]